MSGTASNGVDYTNMTGRVTILANAGTTNISIQPIADSLIEGAETVVVTIVETNTYLIDQYTYVAPLLVKDTPTTMSVYPHADAVETNGPPGAASVTGSFLIQRGGDDNLFPAMEVRYSMSGTASNGVDYTFLNGTMSFALGENSKYVDVIPVDDTLVEGLESAVLTLLPTNTCVITTQSNATVTVADTATTVSITQVQHATEPGFGITVPPQVGIFRIERYDSHSPTMALPALTILFQISGTASNNIDYTNLVGSVTFAAGETVTNIFVHPVGDLLFEGDETVTVDLQLSGEKYFIDPSAAQATLTISDGSGFQLVAVNISSPPGIDYHQPSNSLIVSCNSAAGGIPFNFVRIYTNTVSSNIVSVVTNWSNVHGVGDELKLVTAKTTANGFTNGDMFFSSDMGIGWLSADGTRSNLNWCVLTNSFETNSLPIRGGLCFDTTGLFSNQLIVVTSPGTQSPGNKGVWRIRSNGTNGIPTLITNINTPHLEGVTVIPNDVARWGPWAGKIVTGDEVNFPPLIYAIASNGVVTNYDTTTFTSGGILPEDFDIIPANQDLYVCDQARSAVAKLSRNYFTNFVGDLLITDELSSPHSMFIVHWNAATTNFTTVPIPFQYSDGVEGMFEHVTFAPLNLPPLTP
ncbi:MAG: hypothetical protein D4R57_00715 [Verrucomicrobiales bacterium]|nr:MAG: hypothetical protein D4R57_00715 [Verrucomicrobiales bacterium]